MPANKTTTTSASVSQFLDDFVDNDAKRADSLQLIELMRQWSGFEPKMYGQSIIGFGNYHYKYASGHEGDAPLIAFSPRKAAFSLYVNSPGADDQELLSRLGKFKMGKGCIYFKKLSDINLEVLEELSKATIAWLRKTYTAE